MKKSLPILLIILGCYNCFAQDDKYLTELRNKLHTGNDSLRTFTLMRIGTYFNQQDNFDSATYYYTQALQLAKKINLPQGICAAYNNCGEMEYKYERYEKALEFYLKALETSEKNQLYSSMGISYAMMGSVFEDERKPKLAVDYYLKAVDAHIKAKDTIRLPATYVKLSSIYLDMGQPDSSKKYFDNALQICDQLLQKETALPRINALKLYRRGALHVKALFLEKKNQLEEALSVYNQLADEVKDMDGVQQKVTYQIDIAGVYDKMGKFDKGLLHLQQGLEWLKEDSIPYLYSNIYEELTTAYAGQGLYKNAFESQKKFKAISDSILNKENLAITTDMQTKYETEKKEQQIASLNFEKKNQKIILGISIGAFIIALGLLVFLLRAKQLQRKLFAKEKEVQQTETEKKIFELEQTALRAQMNPHFIFNSLNSVQRYVIANDPEGVNQYLATFARLIRQTLENSGKQLIPLKDEVQYLDTYLQLEKMRNNNRFKYRIDVNPDIDPEQTYIPNMIIQPFLENSVIHGMAGKKQDEGFINLSISKNHKLTCIVEDNGGGITASKIEKQPIDDDHRSMGTAITDRRIQMLNSLNKEKIELQIMDRSEYSTEETGTRITIKFPLHSSN